MHYLSLIEMQEREPVRVFLRLYFVIQLCGWEFLVQRYKDQLLTLMSSALSAPIGARDNRWARTALSTSREYAADSLLPFRRWNNPGGELRTSCVTYSTCLGKMIKLKHPNRHPASQPVPVAFGTLHSAASLPLLLTWLLMGVQNYLPEQAKMCNVFLMHLYHLTCLQNKCFAIQLMRDPSDASHCRYPSRSILPPTDGPLLLFFSFLVPVTLPNLSWTFGGLVTI